MGIRLTLLRVRSLEELEHAFTLITRDRPDALYVAAVGAVISHRARVIEFAALQRLPAIYTVNFVVKEGGLMAYAANQAALLRRTAAIFDRILKGARPADLPVEQPTQFELAINLKTAKTLGLTLPQSLLLRATEVIE
jgi:putative ABC transport system substrate-binding protein